MIITIN